MYIWMTDFDMRGSGYRNLSARLVNELILTHHIGVTVLGLHYKGEPHHWPFSVVPVLRFEEYLQHIKAMAQAGFKIDGIIVAFDIPMQLIVIQTFGNAYPIHSIFPVESGPLHMKWASGLAQATSRFTLSQTAVQSLDAYNIPATFLPLGVDEPDIWQPIATQAEKDEIRARMGIEPDTFLIFTNADNQERKNLSDTFAAFSRFAVNITERDPQTGYVTKTEDRRKAHWILLTRPGNFMQGGHDLDDLAMRHGVFGKVTMLERGVPTADVRKLTAAADCFMLFSKAGGLEIPVIEAMACGVPVIGINAHAIGEHLADGRGIPVQPAWEHMDVWGNGLRHYVDVDEAVRALDNLYEHGPDKAMLQRAQQYANGLNWKIAGNILASELKKTDGTKDTHGETQTQQQLEPQTIGK